eukprot:CAMPEP_0206186542 /NCGR_PEP_ID=MMETSP0166-20121206/2462_1 /ASSEMBLY_ACC=CAM_ASM_000260 /TAXON_ID=95228 /ORGANISM="Vannella robusta, Strain DIVA3 518/3/11/1/6" /LENGTH=416 /DNA_ID=CAMNT_0053601941 /DNA_START=1087 /DNA_END=2337 /DNA_ORIENTATION=+
MYQKMLSRTKISHENADRNWFLLKKIFLFVHNVRFIESTLDERKGSTELLINPMINLPYLIQGIKELCKDDQFGKRIPELEQLDKETKHKTRIEDDPIVSAYLHYVDNSWKPCNLSFINIAAPNYIDVATVTFLNSANPRELFKLSNKATGKGGYGQVFTAKDSSGNRIAIKKMEHLDPIQSAKNFREVAVMATLTHPNIVKYYDCFQYGNDLWVTMELLSGGSLSDMHDIAMFEEDQIAYVAQECLQGLHYLHQLGLCHRDIKPGNVMLTNSGCVKLIDFGLCDSVQSIASNPKMVGSPFWMPPEMIFRTPQTTKADVWSLGCTLLQLIDPDGFDIGCPLKTLFTVATEGRTKFMLQGKNFSSNLIHFLECMLRRQPHERASVRELLKHPFLSKHVPKECVQPLIDQFAASRHFC